MTLNPDNLAYSLCIIKNRSVEKIPECTPVEMSVALRYLEIIEEMSKIPGFNIKKVHKDLIIEKEKISVQSKNRVKEKLFELTVANWLLNQGIEIVSVERPIAKKCKIAPDYLCKNKDGMLFYVEVVSIDRDLTEIRQFMEDVKLELSEYLKKSSIKEKNFRFRLRSTFTPNNRSSLNMERFKNYKNELALCILRLES